jgi:hypothetical protein
MDRFLLFLYETLATSLHVFKKKIIHSANPYVLGVSMGCAFPCNDIGGVA